MSDSLALTQAGDAAADPSAAERGRRRATCEELARIGMELIGELRPGPLAAVDPAAEEARLEQARLNIAAFAAGGRVVVTCLRQAAEDEEPRPARRRESEDERFARRPCADYDRDFRAAVAAARAAEREAAREIEAAEAEVGACEAPSDTVRALHEKVAESFRRRDVSGPPLPMAAAGPCEPTRSRPDGRDPNGSGWSASARHSGPDDTPPLE